MAQIGRVAAVDQEHVGLPDPGGPALCADGGQRGELQDAERRPAQAGQVLEIGLGGDETPYRQRTARRVTPLGRRDAERAALGDRLAEQLHERRMDARVRDATRREQQLQDASRCAYVLRPTCAWDHTQVQRTSKAATVATPDRT